MIKYFGRGTRWNDDMGQVNGEWDVASSNNQAQIGVDASEFSRFPVNLLLMVLVGCFGSRYKRLFHCQ